MRRISYNMKQKIFALLTVVVMLFQVLPIALADDDDNDTPPMPTPTPAPYRWTDEDEVVKPNADNSNTYVQVTRTINEVSTVIYTGLLSGYDNGVWSNFDFVSNHTVSVFDWVNESCDTISVIMLGDDDDNNPSGTDEPSTGDDDSTSNNAPSRPMLMGMAPYSNTDEHYSIVAKFYNDDDNDLDTIDESCGINVAFENGSNFGENNARAIAEIVISPGETKQLELIQCICGGNAGIHNYITID